MRPNIATAKTVRTFLIPPNRSDFGRSASAATEQGASSVRVEAAMSAWAAEACVHWIAKLGGFLGRKADGEPGVKTIWQGLRRLHDIAATINASLFGVWISMVVKSRSHS